MKKLIALILCLATVLTVLASCGFDPDEKGAVVNMYLFNEIRNFDPLYAYTNASSVEYDGDTSGNGQFLSKLNANAEAVELLGLLYEGLFRLRADGKVEKALAKSYEYIKKEDSKKRLTDDIDGGYVYLTNYMGHTVYRNVDKQATEALPENSGKLVYGYALGYDGSTDPSGIDAEASMKKGAHIVYLDTNNSTTDFHERQKCSLKGE